MAKRKPARKPVAPKKPQSNELEVLFPDRPLTVGGCDLIVREISFEEQLRNNHLLAPLADAFAAIPPHELSGPASINRVMDLLATHWEGVRQLVALSCGQTVEWVSSLRPEEGEELLLTWWVANQSFFIRRLWRPALLAQSRSAGGEYSPASSEPGTAELSSGATPSAS